MTDTKTVWLVGRRHNPHDDLSEWEVQGAFSTEELAKEACRDWTYFYGPLTLDEPLPHERDVWPGVVWPKWDERPKDRDYRNYDEVRRLLAPHKISYHPYNKVSSEGLSRGVALIHEGVPFKEDGKPPVIFLEQDEWNAIMEEFYGDERSEPDLVAEIDRRFYKEHGND